MRTLTFAAAIAMVTAAHAEGPWLNESSVSGVHDVTGLIVVAPSWREVWPPPQFYCDELYLKGRVKDADLYDACKLAERGKPELMMRKLGVVERDSAPD
jgi:hypothetical protein